MPTTVASTIALDFFISSLLIPGDPCHRQVRQCPENLGEAWQPPQDVLAVRRSQQTHRLRQQTGGVTAPQPAEARLLVVDDEANILELLTASLSHAGFEVTPVSRGTDAVRAATREAPDLVLLDVMMPGIDGFETLRRLRGEGIRCPVLFLTARDAVEDRVAGLTLGGDDYITKPFSLSEVIARIRAVLRRAGHEGTATEPSGHLLAFADITLDEDAHEVTKAGERVELSPTEFKLLRFLMENQGRVMSKAQILDNVWSYDFGGDGNVVESYISYLRRKVDTSEPRLIHTVRGVGYVLRTPR